MATKFDKGEITEAANAIGDLMNDMSAFKALEKHWPNAGKMPLAMWLERIVDDRRNAVVAHAEHLKIAFAQMEEKLKKIAADFSNADGQNAEAISKVIAGLESSVVSAVNTFDKEVESNQHNYSPGQGKGKVGDGYSQNLNTSITT
ncbi:hypothetical protein [Amycolatopsis sp. lyj-90]|uniref:hypothetical protein n=1 Tax=Amycolatopsis sp. lyj-90 TaxID=2789285 RepID=UPI00397E5233